MHRLLTAVAALIAEHRLVGFSSCCIDSIVAIPGSRGQALYLWCMGLVALWGMWDPPRPGIEPMFPALAGGFLTTVPSGKFGCGTLF